jgi:hypothetical protein
MVDGKRQTGWSSLRVIHRREEYASPKTFQIALKTARNDLL